MKRYFTISELCIDPNAALPQDIADRILKYHLWPVNILRVEFGHPIWASSRSCWRPEQWERAHGRAPDQSGSRSSWSRHTFKKDPIKDPEGKGASDWTTYKRTDAMKALAYGLATSSEYSRLVWYPDYDEDDIDEHFIHCDYGFEDRGRRYFYNDGGWKQVESLQEWLEMIKV